MMKQVSAFALLFLLVFPSISLAKKKKEEEPKVDTIALASRLFQDGFVDRATKTLAQTDLEDPEVDKPLYFLLSGLIALKQSDFNKAIVSLKKAIDLGHPDPLVKINLAKAYFGKKEFPKALAVLLLVKPTVEKDSDAWLLLCRTYWEMNDANKTLVAIDRGKALFPTLIDFPRLEMHVLIKLGLFREIADKRNAFLKHKGVEADDITALSEALRKTGQLKEAEIMLTEGLATHKRNIPMNLLLSRVLLDQDKKISAALILEEVAQYEEKYLLEAAELYRRAERLDRALYLNKRISDQGTKMKQRLQILLQMERFEMVSAMEPRLARLGLLENDSIRYALAYGLFQIKDFDRARKHLKTLKDPEVFQKSLELRQAIQECEAADWLCH